MAAGLPACEPLNDDNQKVLEAIMAARFAPAP
jgi:hypothetical protein